MISRRAVIAMPFIARGIAQAAAADYPSRPVTLIVPFSAGGGADAAGRFLADLAKDALGVAVVVENFPGGGATIGSDRVARARADGYTLGLLSSSPLVIAPAVQNVPYDVAKDFTLLGQFSVSPNSVIVRSDSAFKTLSDLIAFGRVNPDRLTWAPPGARTASDIMMQATLQQEGIKAISVPTKGASEAITLLLGGHIDFVATTGWGPQLDAGKIRVLAEMGPDKIPGMPDVPTFRQLGYRVSLTTFYGLAGPAGLPPALAARWEGLVRDFTQSPRFLEFARRSRDVAAYKDPAAFRQGVLREAAEVRHVVEALGITRP